MLRALSPQNMGSATAVSVLTSQPRGAARMFSTVEGVLEYIMTFPARKHRTGLPRTLELEMVSRRALERHNADPKALGCPRDGPLVGFRTKALLKAWPEEPGIKSKADSRRGLTSLQVCV